MHVTDTTLKDQILLFAIVNSALRLCRCVFKPWHFEVLVLAVFISYNDSTSLSVKPRLNQVQVYSTVLLLRAHGFILMVYQKTGKRNNENDVFFNQEVLPPNLSI